MKKDNSSRRGLLNLVSKRRRLLNYLKKRNTQEYVKVVDKLKLRKCDYVKLNLINVDYI